MTVERPDPKEKVMALCRRRGFVSPSSEIHGLLDRLRERFA